MYLQINLFGANITLHQLNTLLAKRRSGEFYVFSLSSTTAKMTSFAKGTELVGNPLGGATENPLRATSPERKRADRKRSHSLVDIRSKHADDDHHSEKLDNVAHLYEVLRGVEKAYTTDVDKGLPVLNENHITEFMILIESPHIAQSTLDKILVLALLIPDKDKHYELVENVVMHGADVNWSSYYGFGQRPVHYASRFGHIKCLELLLRYNANASLTDEEGRTALHLASIFQNIAIVRLLLNTGVNHDLEDHYGRTALHAAIESIDGIEAEVMGTSSSRLFYLRHSFEMIDKDGSGHALMADISHVVKSHGMGMPIIYEEGERADFDKFMGCLHVDMQNKILLKTAHTKVEAQNELIRLLLTSYGDEEAKLVALQNRDHHGQVAFGISARQRWYVQNYQDMKEIFQNPVEEGFDSEIFQDPRTMLSVTTEWNSLVKPKRLVRWFYHFIFTLIMTTYAINISWKMSRKVGSFEVGLKQALVYQEYDEHNTEAYFDMESLEEWGLWSKNVLLKEFYPDPIPYDFVNSTTNKIERNFVKRKIRGYNKLIGKLRLRVVRQFPSSSKGCSPIYSTGVLNTDDIQVPCYADEKATGSRPSDIWVVGEDLKLTHETREGNSFAGQATTLRSDSGFSHYFDPQNKTRAFEVLRILTENKAIENLNTRAVFYEFVIYNVELSLVSVITLGTENIVSGAVVPNAVFVTYQILPYTPSTMLRLIALEVLVYCFMIHQVYTWLVDRKVRKMYYKSDLFKNTIGGNPKYRSAVKKWFYPMIIPTRFSRATDSFSTLADYMQARATKLRNHDHSPRHRASTLGGSPKDNLRQCFFKHSDQHVCKAMWRNPNTNAEEFTFERHCTQYLLPVPFTKYCLVLVESEVPRQWNILRGYGSFCFDFPAYHVLMTFMFLAVFICHMFQIFGAKTLFGAEDAALGFSEIAQYFGYVVRIKLSIFGFLLFVCWLEALRNLAVLSPSLMNLMMIIQGMTAKLGVWAMLSVFAFCAFSSIEYITFGAERGIKTATEFLVESFVKASGQSEFESNAENLNDMFFVQVSNIAFIFLFTIVIMNLLIAFMTEAYDSVKLSAAARFCYMQFEQVQFHQLVKSKFDQRKHTALHHLMKRVGLGLSVTKRLNSVGASMKSGGRKIPRRLISRVSSWGEKKAYNNSFATMQIGKKKKGLDEKKNRSDEKQKGSDEKKNGSDELQTPGNS